MNVELDNFMAEKVMGWHRLMWWVTQIEQTPCWVYERYLIMRCSDWHPTEDQNQAMMCAEKIIRHDIRLQLEWDFIGSRIYFKDDFMNVLSERYALSCAELPGVICEALLEAMQA